MRSARRLAVPAIAWILTAPLSMMALAARQEPPVSTPDPDPPTALEQALIERICSATSIEAHQVCLSSQLNSLRADFGRDLTRLSGSERRTLDSACNRIRTEQGREGYLDCLRTQLGAMRNRRPAKPAAPYAPAPSPPSISVSSASPAPPALAGSSVSGVWVGAAIVTVLVAAGGVLLTVRARRAAPRGRGGGLNTCRVCGEEVREAGDMCQKCRHEAAETLRRAAAERADRERAQQEEPIRRREEEEAQRRQKVQQEEEARLQQQEEARQREEHARQQEEEARQRSQPVVVAEEVFDPYAVLDVPKGSSQVAIDAAYLEAKAKYDPDNVSHLGMDLQEHFRLKAKAVERAYLMLTG